MQNRPQAPNSSVQPDSGPVPSADVATAPAVRWAKPVLSAHGDVRQLTLGPSPGTGESGNELSLRP